MSASPGFVIPSRSYYVGRVVSLSTCQLVSGSGPFALSPCAITPSHSLPPSGSIYNIARWLACVVILSAKAFNSAPFSALFSSSCQFIFALVCVGKTPFL